MQRHQCFVWLSVFIIMSATSLMKSCYGFSFIPRSSSSSSLSVPSTTWIRTTSRLYGASNNKDDTPHDNNKEEDEEIVITKEMFLRQMLQSSAGDPFTEQPPPEVTVQKKKKGNKQQSQQRKNHDNRDILPFQVTLQTPDPYTHPEIKRRNAKQQRKRANAVEEHLVPSRIYDMSNNNNKHKNNDGTFDNTSTILGEFRLEKHTTTGDILNIQNVQYKIIRHRCQYKYAGGAKFVMVRKILEVKEIGRLQTESYLQRQFENSSVGDNDEGS